MQNCEMVDQECLFVQDFSYGKTSQEPSQVGSRKERTSVSFWKRSSGLAAAPYQFLDLTPGHGNLLGESYWETRSPYVGESLTLSTGVSPKDVIVSSLSQILEDSPLSKYYLSKTACLGILRRAKERGKELPPQLETALMMQAEQYPPNDGSIAPIAFAANQRDEVRDLHDIAGALGAQPGMKQQTFVAASFSAGAGSSAGGIGYTEEGSPTLKSTEGGNMVPAVLCLNNQDRRHIDWTEDIASTLLSQAGGSPTVLSSEEMIMLCLNDQGGRRMDAHENVSGTLRSQEHGHQPLVMATQQGGAEIGINLCPTITSAAGTSGNNQPILFENHGIDSRYTGPHPVAPTMSARYGTGGNNVPLIGQMEPILCIMGNAIDRQPHNGGNGIGYQSDLPYTLTTTDHHAVFSRQRVDVFREDDVTSTESARQNKDATDLILQKESKDTSQRLIRRLTPLECERLQGFPDGWTQISGASDSSRYKALGNSVAIPCVEFIMRGIVNQF
ncbi:MAG: hypothetical protein E7298_14380 [Lachnospiraceae bacterium]|nr:hypothetical protein [Lachnospiraceae bacterium]